MQMVVQRELRAGSRRPITYWGRFFAAAAGVFALWQGSQAADQGRDLFFVTAIVAFAMCLLDAIRRAAASIAEEKADGTLGLLILTPLSGSELLFGKFFSVALAALPLALAVVPVFGICVLLGGVSGGEFIRLTLALAHCLTIAIFIGIFVSSNTRGTLGAMFLTIVILGLISIVSAPLSVFRIFNPLGPLITISDFGYRMSPGLFWISLIVTQAAVFTLLWLYGRRFAERWRRDQEFELPVPTYSPLSTTATPSTPFTAQDHPTPAHYDVFSTPKWFIGNPIEWLTLREMSMHSGGIVWTIGALVCAGFSFTPISLFYSFLFSAGLVIFLCIASARTFAVARQSNSIELLITTPLGVEGMIEGHIAALKKMFFVPGAVMVGTFAAYLIIQTIWKGAIYERFEITSRAGFGWYGLIGFTLLLLAAPWIGMWMGLRCKTPARAILSTIALVLILPRFGGCIMIDPFYFVILWAIARRQVYTSFNKLISQKPAPLFPP
jgi:hypothetical protein